MDFDIAPLTPEGFSDAYALWESSEGDVLQSEERHPHVFVNFLSRNPNLSFGARRAGRLIGAVLAGHDGRRGYSPDRSQSVAQAAVSQPRQLSTLIRR